MGPSFGSRAMEIQIPKVSLIYWTSRVLPVASVEAGQHIIEH
jgi:hypothetical protein